MRSLIIQRLAFLLLLVLAYMGSLQWEQYRSNQIIQQLLTGQLDAADYVIDWQAPNAALSASLTTLAGSQILGSEAEIFYGQIYFLRTVEGVELIITIYPGLFWTDSISLRKAKN